jgi:hypothetical protein
MSKEEKKEYLGWDGVKKLAKELGYSWFDVCDIIWKTKYHKHPKLKEILLFSVIKKNLINIESNKQVFDLDCAILCRGVRRRIAFFSQSNKQI